MKRNVVVLYNDSVSLVKGESRDMLAERGVVRCAAAVTAALRSVGHRVVSMPVRRSVEEALADYSPTDWVIFNLGEGLHGRLFEEARMAWALEAMGYRFTGADGDALLRSTHKAQAKSLLRRAGVITPDWYVFRDPDEVQVDDVAPDGSLRWPLIVKPVAEDASLGIGSGAIVHTVAELSDRVDFVVSRYRQVALAEQFVIGREFNISLWGDPVQVLPLAEIDFDAFVEPYERIVSFAAKWEEGSFPYQHTPVVCPACADRRLVDRITGMALKAWEAMGCCGYARVDMRVGEDGTPYVLEVNCNPDLSPDAGFFRAAHAGGCDYEEMVEYILKMACSEDWRAEVSHKMIMQAQVRDGVHI